MPNGTQEDLVDAVIVAEASEGPDQIARLRSQAVRPADGGEAAWDANRRLRRMTSAVPSSRPTSAVADLAHKQA
ncbi:MAG: hypothetical protein LBV34_26180 [Nocardiopsaceae bacterium]|nr:hypothetical protein [Nocardiopsaceae bacterium]